MRGLKWSDIDFENRIIHIRQNVTYDSNNNKFIVGELKTNSGYRDILMTGIVCELLIDIKRNNAKKKTNVLSFEFADHIFLNSNNRLIPNLNYDSYLERICNKAGVEKISMHTLRHTFATRCIESGMKLKTLQKDGFMFGKIMQDSELCKGLLQRILPDLEIDRIEYPELQKSIRPDADAKSVRLDVYVRDDKGTIYDVELQMTDTKELPRRMRYYQSVIDLQMIDRGELYKKLKPSYIIFICPFDLFGKGRHIYTFENICKEDTTVSLGDDAIKIFLNTDSETDDVSRELRAFLDYVAGRDSDDSYVRRLKEAVEKARKNREWRYEYI